MDGENSLKRFRDIVEQARKQGASDVHLASGMHVLLRIDGELQPLGEERIETFWIETLAEGMFTDEQKEILRDTGEVVFGYSLSGCCRLRVDLFRQRGTYAMAIRLLPLEVPAIEELGIPEIVLELTEKKSGLLLVTGAAGSGVTTTLAALIEKIAQKGTRAIVTIEKPIEYLHTYGQSVILQREVGADSVSYADALSAAARQDANVILVGSLQDDQTLSHALSAAETGCLVLAAAGESSTEAAIERLIRLGDADRQICRRFARVFAGATAQKLLPRQDGMGRVAAFEVVKADSAVRSLIGEGRIQQLSSILESGGKTGMQMMDDAIYDLYMKSSISAETAIMYAEDPDDMGRKVQLF